MDCSDLREDLLDVLYGEAETEAAERFEAHAAACAACRDELASLGGVRRALQAWGVAGSPKRRFASLAMPSLRTLAAAASVAVAFGAGLVVSRVEVRNGEIAFKYASARAATGVDLSQKLAQDETEYRTELAALKQLVSQQQPSVLQASTGASTNGIGVGDGAAVRRVQDLVRESEARQAVLLQTSLSQFAQQSEAQRRYDLAQISAGFAYLQKTTGADVAQTNELVSRILRTSQEEGK
jgi:hypothetical protein